MRPRAVDAVGRKVFRAKLAKNAKENHSSGSSQQQILLDYPQLEPEDFLAIYRRLSAFIGGYILLWLPEKRKP
jgi:hypothetical protein